MDTMSNFLIRKPARTSCTDDLRRRLFLCFVLSIFFTSLFSVTASEIDNEVEDMMDMGVDIGTPIEVDLGIPDVQATVGKLFSYSIPDTAFSSGPTKYRFKVFQTKDIEQKLPKWLHFNETTSTLQGIPQMKDLGKVKLTVEASYPSYSGVNSKSETSFEIEVKNPVKVTSIPSDGMETGSLSKIVKCEPNEATTYISIQLDSDLNKNSASDAIKLLTKLSREMSLPRDIVRMFSLDDGKSMFGLSSLVDGGPGNARVKRHASSAVLQWQVGCSGSVHKHHKPSVEKVAMTAKDGELAETLGSPVIGWLLSRDSIFMDDENGLREKRSVIVDDPVGYKDPETSYTDEYEEAEPESRIIPSMVSPTFGMASASPSLEQHNHHHHHRVKRKGRHARADSIMHHKIADPNNMYFGGTPVLTPAIMPTRPTEAIVTTVIDERSKPVMPTMTSSPAVIPTDIQPTPSVKSSVIEGNTRVFIPIFKKTTKGPSVTKAYKNFPPMIANRLRKLVNTAGKLFSYKIPANTFTDFEDGDTRKLRLKFLTEELTMLPKDSWIQFDPENQVIYSLPLDENIGSYIFTLEACDSEHTCVRDVIDISVRQHQQSRAFHHKFMVKVKFNAYKYPLFIDWKKEFVEKLAGFYGDANTEAITVRDADTNQMQISWTNDTLPLHPCPSKTIEGLYKQIVSKKKKKPKHGSRRFRDHMKCCFEIVKVDLEMTHSCEGRSSIPPTEAPINVFTDGKLPVDKVTNKSVGGKVNTRPLQRNQIDHINATAGQVLAFIIPDDTFFDVEDSHIGKLKLNFMDMNGAFMPNSSWIQYNPFTKELYGLPFDDDVGEQEYQISAVDTGGLSVHDAFLVKVAPRPKLNKIIEFSMTLDHDYSSFRDDVSKQVKVVRKLAMLMGDSDTSNITVISINKGSVKFEWTNVSIAQQEKPSADAINYVVHRMFNNNETISQRLIDIMKPEFKVTDAKPLPQGIHLGEGTPTSDDIVPPIRPKKTEHATSNDDIYITTIIPAVIIAAMLIIAAIIACILYRKRRKGKMTMQDNNTFVSKGIPIIFADELDDNKSGQPANNKGKSPALLRDEKPPLPPPEYSKSGGPNQSDSEGADSPLLEHREPPVPPHSWGSRGHGPIDDSSYDPAAPSYEPPPPFSTNSNSRQTRPKPTPTYRNPPPYVPP